MIHYTDFEYNDVNYSYVRNNKGVKYCNDIFTFDIETSSAFFIKGKWRKFFYTIKDVSIYNNAPKVSWCYIWQFGINDLVIYGRTLEEFKTFFDGLLDFLDCKIIVYVHNLAYETQFLRNIFTIENMFARQKLKPMKWEYKESIWKCSYMLSRLSLENIGIKLNKKYRKLSGTVKYDRLYVPTDKLTKKHLDYCEFDCLVMYEYLLNERQKYQNNILHIPLTQTGKARKELQKVYRDNYNYHNYCKKLVPNLNEYMILREVFLGGLTRANASWSDEFLHNLHSKDETSAYPYVAIAYKYPCTHFVKRKCDIQDIEKDDLYIVNVTFWNIRSKTFLTYIPSSKCECYKGLNDNGRVRKAEKLTISVTCIDFDIIKKTYVWDKMVINELYTSHSDFLDNDYRKLILTFYNDKNKLKGVKGMENIYLTKKEILNSFYGMMVTNIIAEDVKFDTTKGWYNEKLTKKDILEKLEKERTNNKNLTVYSNGVFVTAYARMLLVNACLEVGEDVVYLDTDSVKYLGNHDDFFNTYNKTVVKRLKEVLPSELFDMCSSDGKNYIGQFTDDGNYKEFITYGAKKYGYVQTNEKGKDEIHLTVSGLSKKASQSISQLTEFRKNKVFGYKESGRLEMYYMDNQPKATIKGYEINYRYGLVARPSTYKLNMSKDYELYLYLCESEHEDCDYLNSRKKLEKYLGEEL